MPDRAVAARRLVSFLDARPAGARSASGRALGIKLALQPAPFSSSETGGLLFRARHARSLLSVGFEKNVDYSSINSVDLFVGQ